MNPNPIRIALVEDDPVLSAYLERTLAQAEGVELVWSATTINGAKAHLQTPIDVVLLDIGLPDGNGSDLVSAFNETGRTKTLIVTVFDDRQSVLKAIHSGADGYLVKDSTADEIVKAIETLMDGGSPVSASAAIHLLDMVRGQAIAKASNKGEHGDVRLTPRETELLSLFARGMTYAEAADVLGISRHTVGDHMKSVYRKLAVSSRSEAVYEAIQSNLIGL